MTVSKNDVMAQLEHLTAVATALMRESSPCFVGVMGGASIDFMTQEELSLRHQLIMSLPSAAEEREAARARIQERLASRRSRSKAPAISLAP